MEKEIKIDLQKFKQTASNYLDEFATTEIFINLCVSVLLLFVAKILSGKFKTYFDNFLQKIKKDTWYLPAINSVAKLLFPIAGLLIFSLYSTVAAYSGFSNKIPSVVTSLFFAWVVINFATSMLGKGILVKIIKFIVLLAVGLNILGFLDSTIELLESITFGLNDEKEISLFAILKGVSLFLILLWITFFISGKAEKRINKSKELTPSIKVLISKITRISLFTFTILIGLMSVGLDLTVFTVFGGAIGVGVGFGLQKIISNFISGIILLSDRSIKPGDVIAIGETYGWVNSLSARYVSVITRDGKEHLIPNELLITEKVENWSFSNNDIRIKIPFGVSYNSNVPQVIKLALEAVDKTDRIMKTPEPRCLLCGFGDNSIDFELRVWINDPVNGMANIKSNIMVNLWTVFDENNIEIPFPQRDIHIISDETKSK